MAGSRLAGRKQADRGHRGAMNLRHKKHTIVVDSGELNDLVKIGM